MFLSFSYEYIGYIGYDKETNQHKYRYKIIDSEFEDVSIRSSHISGVGEETVIDVYEKRNLSVAPNLIRAMLFVSKKYSQTINQVIKWNKKFNPKYSKYEADINKYLTLL